MRTCLWGTATVQPVGATATEAGTDCERATAVALLGCQPGKRHKTVGADKGYGVIQRRTRSGSEHQLARGEHAQARGPRRARRLVT